MTLEKTSSFSQFMYKRWLRLFPAMLIVTLLILATGPLLPERPAGTPTLIRAIPGLVFIETHQLAKILGSEVAPIEGSFWSLFVEVKFYIFFGGIFFAARRLAMPVLLCALIPALIVYSARLTSEGKGAEWIYLIGRIVDFASLKYFGWFGAGALMFQYQRRPSPMTLAGAIVLASASVPMCVRQGQGMDAILAGLLVFPVFWAGLRLPALSYLLSMRVPVFIGAISYPLYLIHENAMIALAVKMHAVAPNLAGMLTPLPGALSLMAIAWVIARFGEPSLRAAINNIVGQASYRLKSHL